MLGGDERGPVESISEVGASEEVVSAANVLAVPVVVIEEIIDSVVVPGASELVAIVDEGSVVLEDAMPGEAEYGVGERLDCDELADVELELSES